MPKYSINPIVASATTTSDFQPVEIEVFIEKITPLDTFTSLGVFTFTSDSNSEVSQQIQSLLHSAMMAEVSGSLPPNNTDPGIVPQLCRKYKYRHRHYNSGAWTSWTNVAEDFVVLGGQAYEQWEADPFAGANVVFLHDSKSLAPYAAKGFVYLLAKASGTLNYSFKFKNVNGQDEGTSSFFISVPRANSLVRIPIVKPAANLSPFFTLEVTLATVVSTWNLEADFDLHAQEYDFCYLSSKGSWAFLPCHGAQAGTLEVSQAMAEVNVPAGYYSQTDISQFEVWESKGRKRVTSATGFYPIDILNFISQDFLLSRKRFIWVPAISKWIPVMVNTKNVMYKDQGQTLRSLAFEWSPAFENNLPSTII